uniref:Uncharacterized protein n=1 Tax=Salvator merianae TaxID=96440 RepID=A0A8D0BTJ4_SALMN
MPFIRGPEDRHYFASFQDKDSNAFLKSNPFIPPEDENYPLAPHRDDLSIINPCSGLLSPGAEAEANQQIMSNRTIEALRDGGGTQPPQWVIAPQRKVQTAEERYPVPLQKDQRWNSRAVSDISLRAKIGGKTHYHYYYCRNCDSLLWSLHRNQSKWKSVPK